jgi:hypothetical protein
MSLEVVTGCCERNALGSMPACWITFGSGRLGRMAYAEICSARIRIGLSIA